ncbi:MAG TPA: gamma-glutamylcyclotransferase [Dongiaceae bacterium]|nr:gamma-glutamylcyclotransferase [Dongiaceae bacterium]
MPRSTRPITLTADLVARVERLERNPGPEPGYTRITEAHYDGVVEGLLKQHNPNPLWLFAYGSLIWKPEFTALEHRRGIAYGWHRSFCLELKSWRGTPEMPGLMMALERGGCCEGVAYRLPDNDHHDQLRRLVVREIGYLEDVQTMRWINVRTQNETVRALVFYAGPTGRGYVGKLPVEQTARILARAAGYVGSCAMYLYQTVRKLEEHGIHDGHLWHLQELVAAEIEAMIRSGAAGVLAAAQVSPAIIEDSVEAVTKAEQ